MYKYPIWPTAAILKKSFQVLGEWIYKRTTCLMVFWGQLVYFWFQLRDLCWNLRWLPMATQYYWTILKLDHTVVYWCCKSPIHYCTSCLKYQQISIETLVHLIVMFINANINGINRHSCFPVISTDFQTDILTKQVNCMKNMTLPLQKNQFDHNLSWVFVLISATTLNIANFAYSLQIYSRPE